VHFPRFECRVTPALLLGVVDGAVGVDPVGRAFALAFRDDGLGGEAAGRRTLGGQDSISERRRR
jgi:hypothetical protein